MPINIYRFKISLIEYHAVPANKLHRILDIAGNATFEDLHDLIFTAFDRYDPHLYQFILTREEAKSDYALYDCKERVLDPYSMEDADMMMDEGDIAHNAATFTLDDAKLQEKDFIYYRFDFGDDWMHRLCLEKIYPLEAAAIGDEPYAVRTQAQASHQARQPHTFPTACTICRPFTPTLPHVATLFHDAAHH